MALWVATVNLLALAYCDNFSLFVDVLPGNVPLISYTTSTPNGSLLSLVSDAISSKLAAALGVDHIPECLDPLQGARWLWGLPRSIPGMWQIT